MCYVNMGLGLKFNPPPPFLHDLWLEFEEKAGHRNAWKACDFENEKVSPKV